MIPIAHETSCATTHDLLSHLSALPYTPGEQVAIVAGHFMLMFDHESDSLVPMIHQDAPNDAAKDFSRKMAGDFPVLTFNLGLTLYQRLATQHLHPKLVLAVNDHKFQSHEFQPAATHILRQDGKVQQLRKRFYQSASIPTSLQRALAEQSLSPAEAVLRNALPNSDRGRLGQNTHFFSEKAMRNTFDRRLLKHLKKDPHFRFERRPTASDPSSYALYYRNDATLHEICLTEQGSCGCGGELLEFYLELEALGFSKVIFFVPSECVLPVNVGTFIARSTSTPKLEIFMVSGLGGMGIDYDGKAPITLKAYSDES